MAVQLNHTIVASRNRDASARFLAEVLGLPDPVPFGPFMTVETANNVTLDFVESAGDIAGQHYAFLVSEDDFDVIFGRIEKRGLAFWADPFHRTPGEINRNDGGRGVYFDDPNGHNLEIITRPYGSGT
jgi:catechol 2,3-dioxygenase-like lactoylglutathione lyase family enzyme